MFKQLLCAQSSRCNVPKAASRGHHGSVFALQGFAARNQNQGARIASRRRHLPKPVHRLFRQVQSASRLVLMQVLHRRGAGDQQDVG